MRFFRRKPSTPAVEVQKLDLLPGDVIVLVSPRRVDAQTYGRIKHQFNTILPGHRVVILEAGLRICGVFRPEEDRAEEIGRAHV